MRLSEIAVGDTLAKVGDLAVDGRGNGGTFEGALRSIPWPLGFPNDFLHLA